MNKIIVPPSCVKGMTILVKEDFNKTINIPIVRVNANDVSSVLSKVKRYLLKLAYFSPVIDGDCSTKEILLDPDLISVSKLKILLENVEICEKEITIAYENWSTDDIINSILPDDLKGGSSFSLVGHILHLNLREYMHKYKYAIAAVLIDKIPNVSIVVNKTDIIDNSDNEFRSFSMEKLAGDGELVATVKENGCIFTLDYSKVYWNSRLSTEHKRLCDMVNRNDILFDVMAGVGPFSIPTAKKSVHVYANDLNPESVKYLKINADKNKATNKIEIFNLDGKVFIKEIFKEKYLDYVNENLERCIHIVMNLPSISLDFLPTFVHLLDYSLVTFDNIDKNHLPTMHIYFFTATDCKKSAVDEVSNTLGITDDRLNCHILNTCFIRRVSASKVMMRVSFKIPEFILFEHKTTEPPTKKIKTKEILN